MFSTTVIFGRFLPSMFCVVNLPNNTNSSQGYKPPLRTDDCLTINHLERFNFFRYTNIILGKNCSVFREEFFLL